MAACAVLKPGKWSGAPCMCANILLCISVIALMSYYLHVSSKSAGRQPCGTRQRDKELLKEGRELPYRIR